MDNKHYVRVNENNFILKSFSDAFEQPTELDIFIEDGGRHYNLGLWNNESPKYVYDNGIRECTQVEIDLYKSSISIQIPQPSKTEILEAQVQAVAQAVAEEVNLRGVMQEQILSSQMMSISLQRQILLK